MIHMKVRNKFMIKKLLGLASLVNHCRLLLQSSIAEKHNTDKEFAYLSCKILK